ncbi:MAG TPA: recombinase family protein [Thermoplasmata archaeon]
MAPEKCERCWSRKSIVSREVVADERVDPSIRTQVVALCEHCSDLAPDDPLLFWEVFMRFSSVRELVRNYKAQTEEEALRKLCQEKGFNEHELLRRAKLLKFSAGSVNGDEPRKFSAFLNYASPFGYRYVDGALQVNNEEGKLVGFIFRRYLEGKGIAKICQELNRLGHRTKTGRSWASQTVANILANPVYCGLIRTNGSVRRGKHEPLVEAETFNRVQSELQRRIRRPDQRRDAIPPIRLENYGE